MVRSVEVVAGPQEGLAAVCAAADEQPEEIETRIRQAVAQLDRGWGVLILTDMLGNTPTNISMALAESSQIEVLAGCNMPMLIKLLSSRTEAPVRKIARFVRVYGANHIIWATEHREDRARRRVRGR